MQRQDPLTAQLEDLHRYAVTVPLNRVVELVATAMDAQDAQGWESKHERERFARGLVTAALADHLDRT